MPDLIEGPRHQRLRVTPQPRVIPNSDGVRERAERRDYERVVRQLANAIDARTSEMLSGPVWLVLASGLMLYADVRSGAPLGNATVDDWVERSRDAMEGLAETSPARPFMDAVKNLVSIAYVRSLREHDNVQTAVNTTPWTEDLAVDDAVDAINNALLHQSEVRVSMDMAPLDLLAPDEPSSYIPQSLRGQCPATIGTYRCIDGATHNTQHRFAPWPERCTANQQGMRCLLPSLHTGTNHRYVMPSHLRCDAIHAEHPGERCVLPLQHERNHIFNNWTTAEDRGRCGGMMARLGADGSPVTYHCFGRVTHTNSCRFWDGVGTRCGFADGFGRRCNLPEGHHGDHNRATATAYRWTDARSRQPANLLEPEQAASFDQDVEPLQARCEHRVHDYRCFLTYGHPYGHLYTDEGQWRCEHGISNVGTSEEPRHCALPTNHGGAHFPQWVGRSSRWTDRSR